MRQISNFSAVHWVHLIYVIFFYISKLFSCVEFKSKMFSNLENFLSGNLEQKPLFKIQFLSLIVYSEYFVGKDEFKEAETDTPKSSFSLANDSWLDTSDPCNFEIKTKNKGTAKNDDIECIEETSYVPVKGQKMAAKRLKKIQGLQSSKMV